MITVKDDCEKCIHRKVCKHPAISKNMAEKLSKTKYGSEPKVEETWEDIAEWNEITIEISCPHFMYLPFVPNEGVRIMNKGTSIAMLTDDQGSCGLKDVKEALGIISPSRAMMPK